MFVWVCHNGRRFAFHLRVLHLLQACQEGGGIMVLTAELFLTIVGVILTAFGLGYAIGHNTKK